MVCFVLHYMLFAYHIWYTDSTGIPIHMQLLNETKVCKARGLEPRPVGPSQIYSSVSSHWGTRCHEWIQLRILKHID